MMRGNETQDTRHKVRNKRPEMRDKRDKNERQDKTRYNEGNKTQ